MVRALPHAFPDDPSLVRALVARQPSAAAAAWDRFSPLVRGLLWQSLGAFSDIDDLAQDVFLHFFRRIPDLRDPHALSSFVVGITIRVARGELRRRRLRRWLRLSDDGALPDVPTPGADMDSREALQRLYAILDRVEDEARLAFVLRYVQGLELTEVAEALGCSLATAKRRIAKANQRISVHARGDRTLEPFMDELAGRGTDRSPAEAEGSLLSPSAIADEGSSYDRAVDGDRVTDPELGDRSGIRRDGVALQRAGRDPAHTDPSDLDSGPVSRQRRSRTGGGS